MEKVKKPANTTINLLNLYPAVANNSPTTNTIIEKMILGKV